MQHGASKLPEKFRPRVPVIGCLKIGEVEAGSAGKVRPKKLDHFRLCGPSATAGGVYPDHPAMAEMNKANLKEMTVELVSDDPRINLEVVYAMAGRGHILCRGNGTDAERRLDPKGSLTGDVPFQKLPAGTCGEACAFFRQGACKLASTLRFRIPGHTGLGETWQWRTTSWNSAQDLLGAQQEILELTGGILARIPLTLRITEQRRQALTTNGRTSTNFWTLSLAFEGKEEDLILAVQRARRLKAEMAALAVPTIEDRLRVQKPEILQDMTPTEELALAAEFFPQNGATILPVPLEASAEIPDEATPEPTLGLASENRTPEVDAPSNLAQEAAQDAPQAAAVPAPSTSSPVGATNSQKGLIRKHGLKVHGLDMRALDAKLALPVGEGGLTKKQASDLITKVLQDAPGAFKELGGVLAA